MAQSYTHLCMLNGQRVILYGLPTLAKLMCRQPRTLQKLFVARILPKPILNINSKGLYSEFRWWTADEVEAYVHNLLEYGIKQGASIKKSDFYLHLTRDLDLLKKRIVEGSPIKEKIDYARIAELYRMFSTQQKEQEKKNTVRLTKVRTLKDYKADGLCRNLNKVKELSEKSSERQLIDMQRELNRKRRKIANNILVEQLIDIAQLKETKGEK